MPVPEPRLKQLLLRFAHPLDRHSKFLYREFTISQACETVSQRNSSSGDRTPIFRAIQFGVIFSLQPPD